MAVEKIPPIVSIYDSDILFPEEQYVQSAEFIRSGSDLCLPASYFVIRGRRLMLAVQNSICSTMRTLLTRYK